MHEIITLQLGQRSNYLATHFWNTQESYFTYSSDQESLVDHDILFRPGIGADGTETFTPRTLIYDLKGGFGSLRKINALYEIDEPAVTQGLWNRPAIIQREELIQQSAYQQSLETGATPPILTTESVRYWSDFNRVFYHPKSIVQLNEFELGSTLMPFENWEVGEDLFNSLDKEHDLLDRDLRPLAEEADYMQGIQIMAGIDDAWGGFAARYMDRIRDEYGKTSVCFWGLEDGIRAMPRVNRFAKLSNTARSVADIAPQASLFIPMTMPSATLPSYVMLDRQSQWHISGFLSTALESMFLPSRLKLQNASRQNLDQLVNALNINGNQNIAKLCMSIDQDSASNGHDESESPETQAHSRDRRLPSRQTIINGSAGDGQEETSTLDIEFFPTEIEEQSRSRKSSKKAHVFGQAESHRGDKVAADGDLRSEDDGYQRARRRAAGLPVIQKTRTPLPYSLLDSFPRIFAVNSTSSSIGVRTSLTTDTTVASRLRSLQRVVGRAIGVEEREALSNSLGEIAEAYEEGWDSGSDEDDD